MTASPGAGYYRRIDHIARPGATTERSHSQCFGPIERRHRHLLIREQQMQSVLSRVGPPHLTEYPGWNHNLQAVRNCPVKQGDHALVPAFGRDQWTRV